MRRVALPTIVALLFLVVVPGASAIPQRDTWDTSYQISVDGFAVDVHDYGSDSYFRVGTDGWTWSKQWEGRRDYTNPANQATASLVWNWMTTQSVAAQTDTTLKLAITSHGSIRLVAPSGRVVAFDAGQETVERDMHLSGNAWVPSGDDTLVSWKGPHPMDFGNYFDDAISSLLNP